jgi:hypothetical protein
MDTSKLQPGDRIEADVRGQRFAATYERRVYTGLHKVKDPEPRSTYLHLTSNEIVKKLDQQERLGVGG